MAQSESHATNRAGPFVAGSTSSELIALAGQPDLALRVLEKEEQSRDYYRARCNDLSSAASEFFYRYDGASSLIFQKTRDTHTLPDFIEYIYCWLAEDRLCGFILSGVSSDAGTHAQINEQESAFWDRSTEIAEALAAKYPQCPETFVNYFKFESYPALHQLPGDAPASLFSSYQQLVNVTEDSEPSARIETHHCGPSLILASRKRHEPDIPAAATHSSQYARKFFANDDFLVVYDFKIERYVRTIESIHVFENLVYLSQKLADDIGRRLNSQECARVASNSRKEIERWNASVRQAEEARRERITRLSQIL